MNNKKEKSAPTVAAVQGGKEKISTSSLADKRRFVKGAESQTVTISADRYDELIKLEERYRLIRVAVENDDCEYSLLGSNATNYIRMIMGLPQKEES